MVLHIHADVIGTARGSLRAARWEAFVGRVREFSLVVLLLALGVDWCFLQFRGGLARSFFFMVYSLSGIIALDTFF